MKECWSTTLSVKASDKIPGQMIMNSRINEQPIYLNQRLSSVQQILCIKNSKMKGNYHQSFSKELYVPAGKILRGEIQPTSVFLSENPTTEELEGSELIKESDMTITDQ